MDQPEWIAVDWGTSNLRAWGIGARGDVLFERSADKGMGRLSREDYPSVLGEILGGVVPREGAPLDVVICGMAGARQGWAEAAYLDVPVDLRALHGGGVVPPMPPSRFRPRILPGLCERKPGMEDVMRGEETQLLGLSALSPGFSGTVCMPGTHAKWVRLEGRIVTGFTTAMTGEIFALLSKESVLRHSLLGEQAPDDRDAGLEAGLASGLDGPERLLSLLFKTRAASLLSGRSAGWCAGYLSGLLVGAEIGGCRDWLTGGVVPLVGSPALSQLYARGLALLGVESHIVDATKATLAGLSAARG